MQAEATRNDETTDILHIMQQSRSGFSSVKELLSLSELVSWCSAGGFEIDRDVETARNIRRIAQTMSSARDSTWEFSNKVKETDEVLLRCGIVKRIPNSKVTRNSNIFSP